MNYLYVNISMAYGSFLGLGYAGTQVRGLGLEPGVKRWL